jgi:hypothetical protein
VNPVHNPLAAHLYSGCESVHLRFTHGKVVTGVDRGDKTQRSDQGSSAVSIDGYVSDLQPMTANATYEIISP